VCGVCVCVVCVCVCGCVCGCVCVCESGVQKMNFVRVGEMNRGLWLLNVCATGRQSG